MKNYLVTGAAGFIGAAVCRTLLERGHSVTVVDNLTTGRLENVPEGARFIRGDCQDAGIYARIPQVAYDAIYHIAGQSSGEISFDDPVYDLQTNTQSTLLILKTALRLGCRRVLYASSMSVYGDQPDAPVPETAPCAPKSFYGVGKIASEHYLRIYESYGVRSTALRLFNVYGPGQNMENLRQGMASIFLAHALKDRRILVKGSPERFRDFVHISDVVQSFLSFEDDPKAHGRVFNVCTGRKTTVARLLELMRNCLPFDVEVRFEGSTPGDQFGITGDASRAAELCGWTPRTRLEDGLRGMVDWGLALPRG